MEESKKKTKKKTKTKKKSNKYIVFTFERYAASDECAMVKIYDNNILEFYIDPLPMNYEDREKLSYTPEKIYTKKVKTFKNIEKFFYGKDTEDSGGYFNSILLKLKGNNYVYISSYFYKFKTNDEINKFVSEDNDGWVISIAESNENYYLLEGSSQSYINKKIFPKLHYRRWA